jgi:Protein involved in formate dehydrogenase formation
LRLLPQRGLCPCCGSTPVSGVVTASGQTPGTRYLYCSLCSTAWNHVRAVCITCGRTRSLSLKGIEGDSGAVKAETCNECHTYAKMLYQARDMRVDPFADDLATLGLDLLVGDAGWARHAPNPLLLIGSLPETSPSVAVEPTAPAERVRMKARATSTQPCSKQAGAAVDFIDSIDPKWTCAHFQIARRLHHGRWP